MPAGQTQEIESQKKEEWREESQNESSVYKFGSQNSNNTRSYVKSRTYGVESFEETMQNPDTRDYSNVLEQSK